MSISNPGFTSNKSTYYSLVVLSTTSVLLCRILNSWPPLYLLLQIIHLRKFFVIFLFVLVFKIQIFKKSLQMSATLIPLRLRIDFKRFYEMQMWRLPSKVLISWIQIQLKWFYVDSNACVYVCVCIFILISFNFYQFVLSICLFVNLSVCLSVPAFFLYVLI